MIQTTPQAPVPPGWADPNLVFERVQESVVIVIVFIVLAVVAIKVFGPLVRAWAHKLEGKTGDPELRADVDHLRDQLGEVDGLRTRIQELEERIEFTERLLAERRGQDQLPPGARQGGAQ